jgi:inhibitor of cysteine peptidase
MRTASWLISVMMALGGSLYGKGCEGGGGSRDAVVVTERDFGRTVHVNVGDRINVSLHENPSTGYEWRCHWAPRDQLSLVRDSFVPGDPGRPGQGGVRHFILRADTPGRTDVTVQYGRWRSGGNRERAQVFIIRAD